MYHEPKTPAAARGRFNLLFRIVTSVIWAFPFSAIVKAVIEFDQNNFLFRDNYSKNLLAFVTGSVRFGILTLIYGGFPPDFQDEAHTINMYPYIVPTGLLLFFILSRGWRSFEWRPKSQ